jgi:hypothetical protein
MKFSADMPEIGDIQELTATVLLDGMASSR